MRVEVEEGLDVLKGEVFTESILVDLDHFIDLSDIHLLDLGSGHIALLDLELLLGDSVNSNS